MLILTLAFRELRGGLRDFRLFLGCLIVGVTVIASVGLLAHRVEDGIHNDAKSLLGGDVELSVTNTRLSGQQLDFLHSYGKVSVTIGMRAMATFGDHSTLVDLKGVDENYPLIGTFEPAERAGLSKALGDNHIIIGEDLRARLGVKDGDTLTLGDALFVISGGIRKEPDHISGSFSLGPRVIASLAALDKAGLLQPGSLIHYNYRLLLNDPAKLYAFKKDLAGRFPHAPWIVKSFNENNRTVQGLVERLQLFLTLAGLSSLLIGGVGILNASETYIHAKSETIAIFKALGAQGITVFAIYMTVLCVITLCGVAASLLLGEFASQLLLPYLAAYFPISNDARHDSAPLLLAAGFGILTVLTFSVAALSRGVEVKPTILFRGLSAGEVLRLTPAKAAINIILAISLIALVILTSGDRTIATGFILIALMCFGIFIACARLMIIMSRRVRVQPGRLRMAVANLGRPGASVFSIMLSIGIGLSVLVALLLVEGNIERDINDAIPAQAPSIFLIDIQPEQNLKLGEFLKMKPYVSDLVTEPMVRGRISRLGGVPVEQAHIGDDVKWATESDRGFTYAALPPDGTHIMQGRWWAADYNGPTLASFDQKLALGMGLKIGDTLTLNILGEDITATIANLRNVNYLNLRMNFALILSPGAIERFPATGIATFHIEGQNNEAALMHELAQTFPNISAISVRESLVQFHDIVRRISTAVRITALFTLISGLMVLSSAIAATLDKRAFDTVIFKVLGARERDILLIFLIEWLMTALVTAIIACMFGALGAWLILKRLEWVPFHLSAVSVGEAVGFTLVVILCTGLLLNARVFRLKANAVLRNK